MTTPDAPPTKDKVKFHYLKSNYFRVIHVDGIFGGLTPTGDIFASFFSQRPPIPTLTVQPVKESGELGDELMSERAARDGLVREMEIGVTMRPELAETFINSSIRSSSRGQRWRSVKPRFCIRELHSDLMAA